LQTKLVNKDACFECFPLKQRDVIMAKHGVDYTFKLDDVKSKIKQSNLKQLGVENCMQSQVVKDKFVNTMFERHGVKYAQQSKVIQEKTRQTLIRKYGTTTPQSQYNYNYKYINSKRVSRAQIFIARELSGNLNLNIDGFFADIVIDGGIVIEYNGGGHRLSVLHGQVSEEEFLRKEIRKAKSFKDNGYKYLIIENHKDKRLCGADIEKIKQHISLLKNELDDKLILTIE